MITIDGIQVSDYSRTDNGSTITVTAAIKHDAALSSINVDDAVTLTGSVSGLFTYVGLDKHGQRCFTGSV